MPDASAPAPAPSPGTSRSTSATIAPTILRYLARVAHDYDVDLQPLLTRVGLDATVMASTALRVSYRQGSDVIRQAVEQTGDEHLGLRVGAAQHLTAWGLLGFAMMAADTQQEAIETGVRYQNLSGAMTVWSAGWEDAGYVLRADLPDPALDPTVAVFLIEEGYSSVVTLLRLNVGASFAPQAIDFAFPAPRDRRPFEELFRCPVRFDAAGNRMVILTRWAQAAMPGRDPITYASTLDVLDREMASQRNQQELLEVLEISIAQSLPVVPSFLEQARRRASSERTLRRRLADCGTTYEAIVDGVRRERAEQLLRRPELTLRDIARQAGFADVSALRRAVRRWHGATPLELRTELLGREAPSSPAACVTPRP